MAGDRRRTPLALSIALAQAALLAAVAARAEEPAEAMRRVRFQVERTREVANDQVRATVGITDEDADPAVLADRVNQAMRWALERARKAAGVRVESGGYHTYPVHEKGRLRRWRASQEIALEGADSAAVSALVGELQSRLQLRGIEFSVSDERRRQVEEELLIEVIAAYERRAALLREKLRASRHEIVELAIDTGGGAPPRPVHARAFAQAESLDVAPPALEGGTTRLEVRLHATIELD